MLDNDDAGGGEDETSELLVDSVHRHAEDSPDPFLLGP